MRLPPDCSVCTSPMINPAIGGAWWVMAPGDVRGCDFPSCLASLPTFTLSSSLRARSCHHFCLECYEEWAQRKATCPTCRAPVWAIKLDLEFASICGAAITVSAMAKVDDERACESVAGADQCVKIAWPAGLTLANAQKTDQGVLVVKAVRGNGAHKAGVRAGDHILTVNGTAVRDHTTAVDFIEQRCRIGDCLVDIRKSEVRKLWSRLASGAAPRRVARHGSPLGRSSHSSGEEASGDEDEATQ